jgi:hypothetical protein
MQFWRVFARLMRSAAQKSSRDVNDRTARAAAAGLTMLQRAGAFCVDPEQLPSIFIISKPRRGLLRGGESPLSGAAASCPKPTGIVMGGLFDNGGGGAMCVLHS